MFHRTIDVEGVNPDEGTPELCATVQHVRQGTTLIMAQHLSVLYTASPSPHSSLIASDVSTLLGLTRPTSTAVGSSLHDDVLAKSRPAKIGRPQNDGAPIFASASPNNHLSQAQGALNDCLIMSGDGHCHGTPPEKSSALQETHEKPTEEQQPCKDEQSYPPRPLRRKKSSFDLRDVFQQHQEDLEQKEGAQQVTTSPNKSGIPRRSPSPPMSHQRGSATS
ncbi:hypothetical protein BU15DRAFT_61375 [Melanogaster broomeanus]|nr:hypothetical protein BU15DRAFT_61375 [Melanogaster broomeanus]